MNQLHIAMFDSYVSPNNLALFFNVFLGDLNRLI